MHVLYYSVLHWNSCAGDRRISLSFPYIAVHAVSRDASVFPFKPCIYLLYSVPDEDDLEQEISNYRISTQESDQRVWTDNVILINLIPIFIANS